MCTETVSSTLACAPILRDQGNRFLVVSDNVGSPMLLEVHQYRGGYSEQTVSIDVVKKHLEIYEDAVQRTRKLIQVFEN